MAEQIKWHRVNEDPFEYAVQRGPHGDEFVKLLDGSCLRRAVKHAQDASLREALEAAQAHLLKYTGGFAANAEEAALFAKIEAALASRSPAASDSPFAQALADICDDLGCARDNEAALAAIKQLRDQVEEADRMFDRILELDGRFDLIDAQKIARAALTSTVGEPK